MCKSACSGTSSWCTTTTACVGNALGLTSKDVKKLEPLKGQELTDEDKHRLQDLGNNGDKIDPKAWGTWTASVPNYRTSAEEVLGGMKGVEIELASV